jgi:hypothetical protein
MQGFFILRGTKGACVVMFALLITHWRAICELLRLETLAG